MVIVFLQIMQWKAIKNVISVASIIENFFFVKITGFTFNINSTEKTAITTVQFQNFYSEKLVATTKLKTCTFFQRASF